MDIAITYCFPRKRLAPAIVLPALGNKSPPTPGQVVLVVVAHGCMSPTKGYHGTIMMLSSDAKMERRMLRPRFIHYLCTHLRHLDILTSSLVLFDSAPVPYPFIHLPFVLVTVATTGRY